MSELSSPLASGGPPSASTPSANSDSPIDADAPPDWERQGDETVVAFRAFCTYRDLGPSRSLDAAYRQQTGSKPAARASGTWTAWYTVNEWKLRAEAYDDHIERKLRQKREAAAIALRLEREKKHLDQIEEFRDRQRRLGAASTEAATLLIKSTLLRLNALAKETNAPEIPLSQIPIMLRAAAAVAQIGTNAESEALAIDELLGKLDEQQQSEEEDS